MTPDAASLALGLAGLLTTGLVLLRAARHERATWPDAALLLASGGAWTGFVASTARLPVDDPGPGAATQWWLVAVLVLALVGLGLRSLAALRGAGLARSTQVLLGLTVAALGLRLVYPYQILHVELFGSSLLDACFSFPRPATFRDAYGQTSFFLLGALGRWHPALATVPRINAVFSAATVLLSGLLVRRWTGSAVAAAAAALLLAVHPVFLRVGTSEDAHTLGVLMLAGALLAFDRAADDARGPALAVGTAAVLLMLWTRQAFAPLLFVPFLVVAERAGLRTLFQPRFLAAGTTTGAVALAHVLKNTQYEHNRWVHHVFDVIGDFPARLLSEPYPLLDWKLSPLPVPLLLGLGLVALGRGSRVRFAPALGFAVIAALSLPMSMFGPGVQLAYRLPAIYLALLLAAVGAGVAWGWLRRTPTLLRWGVAGVAVATLGVSATAGALSLAVPDPQTDELAFLERTLPRLAPTTVIVTPASTDLFRDNPTHDPRPPWRFPFFLLQGTRLRVASLHEYASETPVPDQPVVFYRNLACSVVTLAEGSPDFRREFHRLFVERGPDASAHATLAAMIATGDPDRQPDPALVPLLRHECLDAAPLGPALGPDFIATIDKPRPGFAPSLFFPLPHMTVGFHAVAGRPTGLGGTPP